MKAEEFQPAESNLKIGDKNTIKKTRKRLKLFIAMETRRNKIQGEKYKGEKKHKTAVLSSKDQYSPLSVNDWDPQDYLKAASNSWYST